MRRPLNRLSDLSGNDLRDSRRAAGLNRSDAALSLGVSERQLASYESGAAAVPLLVELAMEAIAARRAAAASKHTTAGNGNDNGVGEIVDISTANTVSCTIVETTGIDVLITSPAVATEEADADDLYGGGYADDDE